MKIFDDDLARVKKYGYRVTAKVFLELNQLFWILKDAQIHLEASYDAVETGFHRVVSLKMRKAGLELWKLKKIFDSLQDPSKKISSQTIETFDKGIAKIEAEIANEETHEGTEYNFDMESIKPVDKNAEESAQEVHENVLLKAQKVFQVNETEVDNVKPKPFFKSEIEKVAFDESIFILPETLKTKLREKNSFQEDLQKTRNMLVYIGFEYKTKIEEETEENLDTNVAEETFQSSNEVKETRVVFPFDPGEIPEKEEVKANATTESLDEDRKMIEIELKTDAKKSDEEEFILCSSCHPSDVFEHATEEFGEEATKKNEKDGTPATEIRFVFLSLITILKKLRVLMSKYMTTLFLLLMIPNLLSPLYMKTTSDVMTEESYPPDIQEDKKEDDAIEEDFMVTYLHENYPFDRGKTFDTTNDVEEAATVDVDAGKTTPRVPIEDSDVHECSGSRNLIQDDDLFQQVAPSVVLCLHVCNIILRYPAILLAQLHILYRHPASRYIVNNATKSFDIPDVNAESIVDEEPLDREENLEDSPEEVEEEFGTLGDDEVEMNDF